MAKTCYIFFFFPMSFEEHEEQDQTGLWLGTETFLPHFIRVPLGKSQKQHLIQPQATLLTLNRSQFPCTSRGLCIGHSQMQITLGSFYTLHASQSNLPRRDNMKSKHDLTPWLHPPSGSIRRSAVWSHETAAAFL